MEPISDYAFRVQTFTRTKSTTETFEEGDVFTIFDGEIEKEILILAAIQFDSVKDGETNRLLTFCTVREINSKWDNDYFVCSAIRFMTVEKKDKIPFPLNQDVVHDLVKAHFNDKTSIRETTKTRAMWKRNAETMETAKSQKVNTISFLFKLHFVRYLVIYHIDILILMELYWIHQLIPPH
jgi:hypothetical protein